MRRDTWDYSADELLAQCCDRLAIVNANPVAAIEAHQIAVRQQCTDETAWLALTTIILSSARTVAADQARLDYLTTIPEADWPPTPAPFCSRQDDTHDKLQRSIGRQMAG